MSRSSVRTSVSLSEEQYTRVSNLAELNDVSVAWVIRQAVQKYLDEQDNEQIPLPINLKQGSTDV